MKRALAVLLSLLVLVLSGCELVEGPGTAPPSGSGVHITLQDRGKTIALSVGDTFTLMLGGPPPSWEVTIDNEALFTQVMTFAPIPGAQGMWAAKAPGTAHLRAVGTYPCQLQEPACKIASPLFEVTIVVKANASSPK